MSSAVQTVEVDGKSKFSRIYSLLFIATLVSSSRVVLDGTLTFFNSTIQISLTSKTDSCVSLTLSYS